jgi:hypothetical protein
MAVRPSACFGPAPTGRISVKFDIGDPYESPWIKSRFDENGAKISVTFHEDHYVLLLAAVLNRHKSSFELNGITLLR